MEGEQPPPVDLVEPAVRRVVKSRVADPHDQDDIVHDVLVRLLRVRPSLTDEALVAYAIVTARNAVISRARQEERRQALQPKLFERFDASSAEEGPLRDAERQALATALEHLPEEDRAALVAHDADDVPLGALAAERSTTPGAMAARLARARARLRAEYVIAFHRATLPTDSCRPVLLSLAAGDRRRQHALEAQEHLLACPVCPTLSEPLLSRRRPLAALLPALAFRPVRRWAGAHPKVTAVGTGAAVATAVALVLVNLGGTPPKPSPPSAAPVSCGTLSYGGRPVDPSRVPTTAGAPVAGRGMLVQLVVGSGRAFWAGCGSHRILVEFEAGSPPPIAAGQHVTFTGDLSTNPSGFDDKVGIQPDQGRADLDLQGHHVDVNPAAVVIH